MIEHRTGRVTPQTEQPDLELANPLAAHSGYEADERVIALMTAGLGQPETLPVVDERCTWIRTEEDLR